MQAPEYAPARIRLVVLNEWPRDAYFLPRLLIEALEEVPAVVCKHPRPEKHEVGNRRGLDRHADEATA